MQTLTMHQTLATAGDNISSVYFVFRGECIATRIKRKLKVRPGSGKRYGPGDVVGW